MTTKRVTIGAKPTSDHVGAWIRQGNDALPNTPTSRAEIYTARLTIDVTPELRGRIKVRAFHQGVTVAELLRGLLERAFPDDRGPSGR
ncbi:MAG TPA: chromosome partitioning protein ParB [Steroidobacteraceae bacterium]